jgi:hypothetical protein
VVSQEEPARAADRFADAAIRDPLARAVPGARASRRRIRRRRRVAIQAHGGQRLTRDLDVAIGVLGPDRQRSRSVPSAAMLASGDQWHLVTDYGRLDPSDRPQDLADVQLLESLGDEL